MKPVRVVTDRDICCLTVAEGKNPLEMTAISAASAIDPENPARNAALCNGEMQ